MLPKETQTSPENLQQSAVKLEFPADLLTQLEQVKAQAEALSGGNPNWLEEQMGVFELVLPENWETDVELILRANLLKSVIRKNPVWWQEWKDKIKITGEGFEFCELNRDIEIYDEELNLTEYVKFPVTFLTIFMNKMELSDYQYLYNFIQSSGFPGKIRGFLGFQNDFYCFRNHFGKKSQCFSFSDGKVYDISGKQEPFFCRTAMVSIPF